MVEVYRERVRSRMTGLSQAISIRALQYPRQLFAASIVKTRCVLSCTTSLRIILCCLNVVKSKADFSADNRSPISAFFVRAAPMIWSRSSRVNRTWCSSALASRLWSMCRLRAHKRQILSVNVRGCSLVYPARIQERISSLTASSTESHPSMTAILRKNWIRSLPLVVSGRPIAECKAV